MILTSHLDLKSNHRAIGFLVSGVVLEDQSIAAQQSGLIVSDTNLDEWLLGMSYVAHAVIWMHQTLWFDPKYQ